MTDKTYKSATYVQKAVFAAGTDTNSNGIIDYSLDGITYTSCQLPVSSNGGFNHIIFNNGKIIAVGESKAVYSNNYGNNFTSCTISDNGWNYITYGDGTYVVADNNYIAWSEDGVTFTDVEIFFADNLKKVVYGDGYFVTFARDDKIFYQQGLQFQSDKTQGVYMRAQRGNGNRGKCRG